MQLIDGWPFFSEGLPGRGSKWMLYRPMDGEFIAAMGVVLAVMPLGAPALAQQSSATLQARSVSWMLNPMQSPEYSGWRSTMEQFQSHYCLDCSMDQRWS